MCSMSQAPQFPKHPGMDDVSEHWAVPSASRVSCTAHLMPRRCMFLLVEISESMKWPLIISVRDIPMTKNPTAAAAQRMTINQAGIGSEFLGFRTCGFRDKCIYL